jgi:hypothetical protein
VKNKKPKVPVRPLQLSVREVVFPMPVLESFSIALALSKQGYNAFAVRYHIGGERIACEDLAAAISYIFANAEIWIKMVFAIRWNKMNHKTGHFWGDRFIHE